MKRFILYGTAVLALSAPPLFAQVGNGTSGQGGVTPVPNGATQPPRSGGVTDQGGSRPGTGTPDGSNPAPEPGTGATVGVPQGSGTGTDGDRGSGAKRETPARDAKTAAAPAADETFVMEAAQGGMAEVELGRLAVQKASDPRVKEFGQRMVTDHSKANDNLKSLAQDKKITIPADLDAKHRATRDRLAKLSGTAFDHAYVQEMIGDHQKDVADFRKESESGLDPAVKAFAAKTLPTLEEHLKMVEDISQSAGHNAVGTAGHKETGAAKPR
jgi:putative membrane protein